MIARPPADPACLGQSELFGSVDPLHHVEAATHCAQCPVFDWCEKWTAESIALTTNLDCQIEGTWAGKLYGGTPTALRILEEEAIYTEDEARRCHYLRWTGERSDYIDAGERTYQRRQASEQRKRRKVDAA